MLTRPCTERDQRVGGLVGGLEGHVEAARLGRRDRLLTQHPLQDLGGAADLVGVLQPQLQGRVAHRRS